MFPCWDKPSAKATFTLSSTLPANYVAISNTPIAEESAAGADASGVPLKRVTFSTTPKMSSYLLVLVEGELQSVHGQAGKVH
jgi:aminopeptidase N